MKRRFLLLLLVGTMIGALLATACAPDAAAPEEEEAAPAEEEEEEAEPAAPAAKTYKWDLQAVWPAGFMSFVACADVIDRINVASGGRLDMTLHPAGSIVPTYEILDAVHAGALDGEVSGISAQFGKFATAMFFDKYPAGPNAYESYVWLYHGGGIELWQELYDTNDINVHVVGVMGASQAENFGWFDEPVTSLDDFKGLKFRTQGTWGDVLTSLGCSVVTIPGGEVYESARRPEGACRAWLSGRCGVGSLCDGLPGHDRLHRDCGHGHSGRDSAGRCHRGNRRHLERDVGRDGER